MAITSNISNYAKIKSENSEYFHLLEPIFFVYWIPTKLVHLLRLMRLKVNNILSRENQLSYNKIHLHNRNNTVIKCSI